MRNHRHRFITHVNSSMSPIIKEVKGGEREGEGRGGGDSVTANII